MNLAFLAPVAAVAIIHWRRIAGRPLLWTAILVLSATAIFDNYIIGSGVVAYTETSLSGVRIGLAPIEDFGYAIAAILGLPAIWEFLSSGRRKAADA